MELLHQQLFQEKQCKNFYPFIKVVFEIRDKNHYLVQIALSAYGYSTHERSRLYNCYFSSQ
ncbi:hydroxyisourate hydrolase [Chryseobacterium sp. Ch-15]|uniref:Hydroxyisourate hydrolase n=1 Tax=Chryseobacterium muglaense TaxID=2893752 RepID=A0A9Q3YRM3_9FLAO|nr:hydroxyisourate hydrolase [Chryseobacterium muglaense]MCC9032947.1 hydroxyisourate hydrolase [Chryseobacterium muglaense]MCM2553516.1 hydroxyisourate hydrolase [Chryseobacterium muglaense]